MEVNEKIVNYERIVAYCFIAFYPVLPGYFRIVGIPSSKVLSLLLVFLWLMRSKLKIKRKNLNIIVLLAGLKLLVYLYHASLNNIINTLLEDILVLGILLEYFDSTKKIEKGMHILLKTSVVMCFFGLYEFLTQKSFFVLLYNDNFTLGNTPELQMRGLLARSEASFGHAISFGIYLSINALLAMFFYQKNNKKEYLIYYIVLFVTLMTTISRVPILVFILVQIIFLMINYKRGFVKAFFKILPIVAVLVFLFLILPYLINDFKFISNVVIGVFSKSALEQAGDFQNSNPLDYRLSLYGISLKLLKGHYIFGTGSAINYFNYGNSYGKIHYSLDNAYLSWLVSSGIIGLLANTIPIIYSLLATYRFKGKNNIYTLLFSVALMIGLNLFSVAMMSVSRIWLILFAFTWNYTTLDNKNINKHSENKV